MNILNRFGNWWSGLKSDIIKSGFIPWRLWGTAPQFNTYTDDIQKLTVVFSNPALLKVICLQCDLFSLAKAYVYGDGNGKKKGKLYQNDPALNRINNPNPMQSRTQWLWDYMFWKMIGNAYLYLESDLVERTNVPMYWLENSKIEFPLELEKWKDKLILSEARLKEIMSTEIVYRYEDGTTKKIPLNKISHIADLSNGTGNWFKGFSRIDTLYKVISNSEISLDSKNINVRYTGKFLVSGQQDPKDVTKTPMSETEKTDIETKVNGDKQVHAVKSMIDIKRFVDDLRVLELDKSFLSDFYVIGMLYNIPRDVLEAYASSTFENQEKARAGHVSYTLEPAGEALGDMLARRWGYTNKKIVFSWDHLPFTQVFEKERAAIQQTKSLTLNNLLRAGVSMEEINVFLDTEFSELTPLNSGNS